MITSDGDSIRVRLRRTFPAVVVLFLVAHCAHHLVTALPVPLLPYIRDEFALDYTRAALVISAFSVPYGIAQLPSGWLADRFGARKMVCVGISGVALAGLFVGLSTDYVLLLAASALMGALGGGYHPSAPILISAATDPARRGRALGLHMIGGSVAYFAAPLVAAGIAVALGWRAPFVILSIPSIVFGLVLYRILGRRERNAERQESVHRSPTPDDVTTNWPQLITVLILTCFTAAALLSSVAFIPLYLVDVHGYVEHRAALALALFYSTGLWAGIVGGYMSDRLGSIPVVALAALISGPALILIGVASSGLPVIALLLVVGIALYVRSPASESFVLAHSPARHRSTVLGLYFFGAMEGNGVLAPVVGYLIDRFGFTVAYQLSGFAMIGVALLCTLVLFRMRTVRRRSPGG